MPVEDWEKPRGKGQHLTEAEIEQLKVAFNASRPSRDIARELQCSTRVVNKYYSYFRVDGTKQEPSPRVKPTLPGRFYRTSFDL